MSIHASGHDSLLINKTACWKVSVSALRRVFFQELFGEDQQVAEAHPCLATAHDMDPRVSRAHILSYQINLLQGPPV